jgi:hypothetical protein
VTLEVRDDLERTVCQAAMELMERTGSLVLKASAVSGVV